MEVNYYSILKNIFPKDNDLLLGLVLSGQLSLEDAIKESIKPISLLVAFVAYHLEINKSEACDIMDNHIRNGGNFLDFTSSKVIKTKLKKVGTNK